MRGTVTELLRVVADPAGPAAQSWTVRPDPARRAAGRGAWVHPDPGCVAQAERRRAFGRALRVLGGVDSSAVGRYVSASAQQDSEHTAAEPRGSSPTRADGHEGGTQQ